MHNDQGPLNLAVRIAVLTLLCLNMSSLAGGTLYENDFEAMPVGDLPDEFLVLNGGFAIKKDNENKFMELPGAPLDSFGVLFGPARTEGLSVSARIYGTSKGRQHPWFGVGLNGVGGYRLRVSPAKRVVGLIKGDETTAEVLASEPFRWKSGVWTHLRLQIKRVSDSHWRVEGKAWTEGSPEPEKWTLAYEDEKKPIPGRPSVFGAPYSGTPIRYDNLVVSGIGDDSF